MDKLKALMLPAAKVAFAICIAALYWGWGRALWHFWTALPLWLFVLGLFLYLPPATLVFYWAYSSYEAGKAKGNVPPLSMWCVLLLKPMALVHNLALNWGPMTVVFLWPSWRPATTLRLNDYIDHGRAKWGWQVFVAHGIRNQLLNWSDKDGVHR